MAVMFWSDEAEATTDRVTVAQYLAGEAARLAQKQPPTDFERVGRYYGAWGRSVGFRPRTTTTALDPSVAAEVEARLCRWVAWKLAVLRGGGPPRTGLVVRRAGDDVTAIGLGPAAAERVLAWSEAAAVRRRAHGRERGAGGAAPGALLALLRSVDPSTGEIVSSDR